MPPPKKPKTGLSRVEEYLSASEKEELASQGSVHSPDCSSPSHTEELVWQSKDNKDNVKDMYMMIEREGDRNREYQHHNQQDQYKNAPINAYPSPPRQQEVQEEEKYTGSSRRLANLMQTRKVDALFHALHAASTPPPAMESFCRPSSLSPPDSYHSREEVEETTRGGYQPQQQQRSLHQSQQQNDGIVDFRRGSVSPLSVSHHQYNLESSPHHAPSLSPLPLSQPQRGHNEPAHVDSVRPRYPHWQSDEEEEEDEIEEEEEMDDDRHYDEKNYDSRYEPQSSSHMSPPPSPPHRSVPKSEHQEAPLDFSQTAKSVLARMMASPLCNPPPSVPELMRLPSSNNITKERNIYDSSYSPQQQQQPSSSSTTTSSHPPHPHRRQSSPQYGWQVLPSSTSDDSRSLSPGERRPGMTSSGENHNYNSTRHNSVAPRSGSHMYHQITPSTATHNSVLPPRGETSHWNREHYTQLPSSGANGNYSVNNNSSNTSQRQAWEPEETSTVTNMSGEAKESTISSSSSSSTSGAQHLQQHQQHHQHNTSEDQPLQASASVHSMQEMPTSTMHEERKVGRPRYTDKAVTCQRRCQICNDMASGFHYGVWSCEGCKAFFKRSLQGGTVDYVCPATNSCTIDKHRRKSCQACRLRKCLENGMNRGKKGPRGPRGPNKRKLMENGQLPCSPTESCEPRIKIKKEIVEVCETSTGPPVPTLKGQDIHPLADYMMKIDPPTRNSGHDNNLPDNEVNIISSLMKLADTELVDVINWAKSIPGYTDLQLRDRIHLLEASWMEIMMMGILWRSHIHQSSDEVLVFAPDLHLPKQRSLVSGIDSVCEKMYGLAKKFTALQINREEFVLLRSLLLFNAEIADLPSCSKIEALREKLVEALQYTSCERLRKSPERVAHLLLFLPHIRQCSLTAISCMFELGRKHSSIPSYELLQEMIEARSPMVLPPVMCRRLMCGEANTSSSSFSSSASSSRLSPRLLQQTSSSFSSSNNTNIPLSPPVGLGAPSGHYGGGVTVTQHVNQNHTSPPTVSVSVSSQQQYHNITLPQARMSHHPQHPALHPKSLPQQQHQQQQQQHSSRPTLPAQASPSSSSHLPHRYPTMTAYPYGHNPSQK